MPHLAAFPQRALALAALSFAPVASFAQENTAGIGTIEVADPARPSDGTVHPAALAARLHGPLPVSAAEVEHQAGLGRAREAPSLERAPQSERRDPTVIRSSLGLRYFNFTPSSTSIAIGPTRSIQAVNRLAELFNDGWNSIEKGRLTTLAGLHRSVDTQNPQLIWDPHTKRFYYAMSASAGATENRVAFGFSKTASPNNLSSDWCHYTYNYASRFLDHLSLGDNQNFIIFSGNAFQPGFVGADINAISKPRPGTTCQGFNSFKTGFSWNIRDSGGVGVSSPVAANQVDNRRTGYVLARHGSGILDLPSNKLWFFNVTRNPADGKPLFSSARQLTVPTYGIPPVAEQPDSRRLRTGDARLTQAMQARTLHLNETWFTQHTVRHPTEDRSIIRWYEIDPVLNPPVVIRTGTIGEEPVHAGRFFFNAAIGSDRRVDNATLQFGNNFVITYNFSSSTINPSIGAASSVNGNPLTFRTVQNGVAPYLDLSCPNPFDICQWAGASSSPDPRPDPARPRPTRGVVFGAIQYSGNPGPRPDKTDWLTRIFAIQP